jgi:recombination protein RecA
LSKPFDLSKFRKGISKSIEGMSIGFHDPSTWISTGNYCLNYLISGKFETGIPLGKISVFAGPSGSGKSLVVSGNIIKDAQKQGIYCVVVDSENALDEDWLQALGVDTSEDKMLKLNMAMVGDVAKMISDFVKQYKEIPKEDRPKVLFVVDSLGMLLVESNVNQFEAGELSGDFGIKPKQLKSMITNCVNMFGDLDIGLVATNHVYSSQNKYDPDGIISGGSGFLFASSIIVSMEAFKLKEDEEGNKIKEVAGINAKCKVVKSRYNKPFETVNIHIPYAEGLNAYSGLFDLFYDKQHLLTKEGNRYVYVDINGKEHKHWKKDYSANKDGILDLIMKEFDPERVVTTISTEEASIETE